MGIACRAPRERDGMRRWRSRALFGTARRSSRGREHRRVEPVRFLALGDSFTIGTGSSPDAVVPGAPGGSMARQGVHAHARERRGQRLHVRRRHRPRDPLHRIVPPHVRERRRRRERHRSRPVAGRIPRERSAHPRRCEGERRARRRPSAAGLVSLTERCLVRLAAGARGRDREVQRDALGRGAREGAEWVDLYPLMQQQASKGSSGRRAAPLVGGIRRVGRQPRACSRRRARPELPRAVSAVLGAHNRGRGDRRRHARAALPCFVPSSGSTGTIPFDATVLPCRRRSGRARGCC